MTNHTAGDIARWFIAWAEAEDADLSNLKLQKLLYYAQGHYLGMTGRPLFDDDLQAWAHGPVVPSVYRSFKSAGAGPIDPNQVLPDDFDWDAYADVQQHLMKVWNTYGAMAAWSLRNRTHRESPWVTTFDSSERGAVIDKEKLRDFFATPAYAR